MLREVTLFFYDYIVVDDVYFLFGDKRLVDVFGIVAAAHSLLVVVEPEAVKVGYIINESMWPFPTNVPSIRMEMRPERFVCTSRMIAIRKAKEAQKEAPPPPDKQEPPKPELTEATMRKKKEYKQLELW